MVRDCAGGSGRGGRHKGSVVGFGAHGVTIRGRLFQSEGGLFETGISVVVVVDACPVGRCSGTLSGRRG